MSSSRATALAGLVLRVGLLSGGTAAAVPTADSALDARQIAAASGTEAKATDDGAIRISWGRTDVAVEVDRTRLSSAAGLTSWAAFSGTDRQAAMMGDTVVFEDEVDAALDAAFAHGLSVTGLHNHFAYDRPKVSFMHVAGMGPPRDLATAVKAVWDAIRQVRKMNPDPAGSFGGVAPVTGKIDAKAIERIVGRPAPVTNGVAKVTIGRKGTMHGMPIGASMGLTTWAAFSGSDAAAAIDGDFIMTADEVQPVLRALRKAGLHVVSLHNHMIGESPPYYFTHFWGTGSVETLAKGFRQALDQQGIAASNH
ncbi:MAG: DUF1259 domain-containing protein [Lysobacter sp.]|nr:DUF1259 domain-containing protein [Lysobacter sp.]